MENLQLNLLHKKSQGYFTIATNNKKWQQYYFDNIEEININLKQKDIYISQNTFRNKSRQLINLQQLKALYIDIDCYTKNISKEYAKYILENDLYGEIPIPNLLIDSGQGLYYIILLEEDADQLPKWQIIEKYLHKKMEYIGADKKSLDASRVLRIVGSKNGKNNNTVKILETYDYKYTIEDILENYVPDIKPKKKKNYKVDKGEGNKFIQLYNLHNLYYARYKDIMHLIEIRNFNMDGYREITLFLIRYYLTIYADEEKALQEILETNESFTNPLKTDEVINATSSAVTGATENRYKYSNESLIKALNITPLEQKEMATIISKEEKYYRNNKQRAKKIRNEEGLTKKQQELKILTEEIIKLKKKKYTISDIAKKLDINKEKVNRLIKKAKAHA